MSSKISPNSLASGLLLLDKPADFSSHDIIAIARRILKTKKIGHSGTLDPMATGLLLLLIGREATKKQDQFLKLSKTYEGVLKLGEETSSWDAYSEVVSVKDVPPLTPEKIEAAARRLTGTIRQPIPFYSAKRINGKRMYEMAREGQDIERKYNEVTVSWNHLQLCNEQEISFTLHGSCGTYVRSLGFLLAKELGTVGHLVKLRRIAVGPYQVSQAFDGNLLKSVTAEELYKWIKPL